MELQMSNWKQKYEADLERYLKEEKATARCETQEIYKQHRHARRRINYIQEPDKFYSYRYFKRHFDDYRNWQREVGEDLALTYQISSLVDFGCGCGSYLEGARDAGAFVRGYEFMPDLIWEVVPHHVSEFIYYGDVMQEIDVGEPFDCSLSIEVAEHTLPGYEQLIVNNLINSSRRFIFFTAARVGQGGTGHINMRPHEFWIDLFEKSGVKFDAGKSSRLSWKWKNWLGKIARQQYKNIMVFKHY